MQSLLYHTLVHVGIIPIANLVPPQKSYIRK